MYWGHVVVGGWVMIYPSKTVQAPPVLGFSSSVGNSTFLDLNQIGKYCLFLSVFSSIFCSHVECSSYIYLYIYYITYYVYQKDKRKHDVDNKIQSNRWWLLVTTVSNHWCFSHTENWKIKALPKHRNKIFLLGSSEFLVFIYVSCITQVP